MKTRVYPTLLALLIVLAIVYAVVSDIGVLHVLGTADVGWDVSPSRDIPLMLCGNVLNGAAVLLELMPYFIFGVLLGGFLSEFISHAAIEKHMGQGGAKTIGIATVAGCTVPICSCGIVPVLAGLVQTGLPLAPVIAFLISAPMLNPATVAMTVGMLGWPIAIARIIAVFAIAMTTGFLVKYLIERGWLPDPIKLYAPPRLTSEQRRSFTELAIQLANHADGLTTEKLSKLLRRDVAADVALFSRAGLIAHASAEWKLVDRGERDANSTSACFVLSEDEQRTGPLGRCVRRALSFSWASLLGLSKYILPAVAVAGAIKVLLPTDFITTWVGGVTVNSVLLAAVLAVPMYVCTCSDVPMVTALVTKGMGSGAALAFLLGEPGLSIPLLAMLSGVFKKRLLIVYAAVSLVGCIAAGTIYNAIM